MPASRLRSTKLRIGSKLSANTQLKRSAWPYAFVAPFALLFLIFSAYPIFYTARLSFTKTNGTSRAHWIGWENYKYLLQNERFWNSLLTSGQIWILIIPLQLVIAVLLSVILNSQFVKFRAFYRVGYILPFITPLVAVAQIWVVLFDDRHGAINSILNMFGISAIHWLQSPILAKVTLALLFLWKTSGFVIIILLSGLQSIDSTLYEAAKLDGASKYRELVSITIPLLKPSLLFVVILQTLGVFQMFAEPFVVTQGGPYSSTTTAGYYLYNHITRGDLGTGAANSLLLVFVIISISLLFTHFIKSKD